ncbi:MAG: DUF3416 domain-containing protein, partial [Williamsia herbipolensis]|nr:DUF3416 domain-containing protein [Williamsia herbipolensis]
MSTPDPSRPSIGRIPVTELAPTTPNGFPAKAFDGEVLTFGATVFREGHGVIGADLVLERPDGGTRTVPLTLVAPGTDRYEATVQVDSVGTWRWHVESFADDWESWVHGARLKIAAAVDTEATLLDGAALLDRLADESESPAPARAAERVRDTTLDAADRLAAVD